MWKNDNWNPVKFSLPGLKAELSLPGSARTIICLLFVIIQARAVLYSLLLLGKLPHRPCEWCRGKVAKSILRLLIIKLLLSILQHFRSVHLYIKNEYANCKPFLGILEGSSPGKPHLNLLSSFNKHPVLESY